VTEALTGLDLVAWQLRVAAGEPLPQAQEDMAWAGHAIEVRLCAEDAAQGFLPQSGVLRRWRPPAGLRVEHALHSGCTVPPYYDSMVAKLIAQGATREEARRKLIAGLQELQALGLATNQAFLAACLRHPVFAAGQASTAFIAQHLPQLLAPDAAALGRAQAVAAWLLVHSRSAHRGHALAHRLPLGLRYEFDGQALQASVRQTGPHQWEITQGERMQPLQCHEADAQGASLTLGGVRQRVDFEREGAQLWLQLAGQAHAVRDLTLAPAARRGQGDGRGGGQLRASMSARVVAVQAQVGQRVTAGQPLVTLEAMKMEHVHAAGASGTLAALHVAVGDQVAAGRVLAEIEPERGEA
jgi:geranyl-CoA carboxylase alpha subunit